MFKVASKSISPEDLVKFSEKIYFDNKEQLELKSFGKFAVIDIESKQIIVDSDKTTAIQSAQSQYPGRLFYIVQIGNLQSPVGGEMNEMRRYGWSF